VIGDSQTSGILLPISIGNPVASVLMLPITMLLLGQTEGTKHVFFLDNLKSTFTKSLVWAPVPGALLVHFAGKLPPLAKASIRLVGAAAGVTGEEDRRTWKKVSLSVRLKHR
jgi:hypothetical protein